MVKPLEYSDDIMVKKILKDNKEVFLCEECGLGYKDQGTAEKCEYHCKNYKSCSLEITSNAILK
ncbi:hypothetical protein AAA799N04_01627 [Marine Group I thaumarchaeote SCGC AAA799-N04]|uniref:DUF7128 domain-containing protein n=1 Tax=Marine Group I thaumarchaeote SCGC AAA799-N04 TaxID=1502293 RepID=A0A081RL74_9ARCH|nr:hypothetical protein AAA799N04_01627 [Marine Group I thaumarchaeote SCGC AAA799-N04]